MPAFQDKYVYYINNTQEIATVPPVTDYCPSCVHDYYLNYYINNTKEIATVPPVIDCCPSCVHDYYFIPSTVFYFYSPSAKTVHKALSYYFF